MLKTIDKFEHLINVVLLVMLALVVLLATIDLGWIILRGIQSPPVLLLEVGELLDLFGAFLLVLIGVELLQTVRMSSHRRPFMSKWLCWWGSSPLPARLWFWNRKKWTH